jgi:hypothetical protein
MSLIFIWNLKNWNASKTVNLRPVWNYTGVEVRKKNKISDMTTRTNWRVRFFRDKGKMQYRFWGEHHNKKKNLWYKKKMKV